MLELEKKPHLRYNYEIYSFFTLMTVTAFIDAVQAMSAFLPVLIERLVTMAGSLTDEQRQTAIAELEPMHEKLEALYQTQEEILENAEKELEEIRKKDLPAVMHQIEDDEHKDADTIFATQLQAI